MRRGWRTARDCSRSRRRWSEDGTPFARLRRCRLRRGALAPLLIASAAKQSILRSKERMDCFAALAMTLRDLGRSQPSDLTPASQTDPSTPDSALRSKPVSSRGCRPDLLFPSDGLDHGLVQLVPDEHFAAVFLRETLHQSLAVLEGAPGQVRRDTRIERSLALVRHDVNAGLFHRPNSAPPVQLTPSLRAQRSNPFFLCSARWIASLRSQ